VAIESYKHSFKNGLAFLALIDQFTEGNKEILNYHNHSKEHPTDNLTTAFDLAEKHLGIPRLLEPTEVSEGNVDERSLVLYVSLYFHAFVAKEQQKGILEEKERISREKNLLQGSLEDRARLAAQLQDENKRLIEEMDERQEKERNLQDEVEKLKTQLAELQIQLAEQKEKTQQLSESKIELSGVLSGLQGELGNISSMYETETTNRKKEKEDYDVRAKTEIKGFGVLQKNLEEHLEDLYRWQKYLDLETETESFTSDIRPQVLQEITKENFETQLNVLTEKLAKENEDLLKLLKSKEAEKKTKNEANKKKKERQSKKT